MARRLYFGPDGLRISKPGFDAKATADENLLFSTTRPQLQVVDKGSFILASGGNNVYYAGGGEGNEPIVFCGALKNAGMFFVSGFGWSPSTVRAPHIISGGLYVGFTATSVPNYAGRSDAIGQVCKWVAFRGVR